MFGAVLESRNGKEPAEDPFNWVIRAKIQSVMDEQYHRCKVTVEQHLGAYYGERQGSVFARAGVTGRSTVVLFESQANLLIRMLVESIKPLSRHARAFQMIAEMVNGFVTYLDLVVGRIGPRIYLEMRNLPRSESLPQGTGDMWHESRARIGESLDRYRTEFGLPEVAAPEPEAPMMPEADYFPPVAEPEAELPDTQFGLPEAAESLSEEPAPQEAEEEPPILELEPEMEAEPPLAETASEPSPPLSQWHEMWAEIAVQLCMGKLAPENRSDVSRAMSDWFAARGMDGLDDEVEQCARTFWKKFALPARITTNIGRDDGTGADASGFDRLAWQSDSPRGAGLAAGANALPRRADLSCSVATLAPDLEPMGEIDTEPFLDEPDTVCVRYRVSWSMRRDSPIPAPYFDIG